MTDSFAKEFNNKLIFSIRSSTDLPEETLHRKNLAKYEDLEITVSNLDGSKKKKFILKQLIKFINLFIKEKIKSDIEYGDLLIHKEKYDFIPIVTDNFNDIEEGFIVQFISKIPLDTYYNFYVYLSDSDSLEFARKEYSDSEKDSDFEDWDWSEENKDSGKKSKKKSKKKSRRKSKKKSRRKSKKKSRRKSKKKSRRRRSK